MPVLELEEAFRMVYDTLAASLIYGGKYHNAIATFFGFVKIVVFWGAHNFFVGSKLKNLKGACSRARGGLSNGI